MALRMLDDGPRAVSPLPELLGAAHDNREWQRRLALGDPSAAAALRAQFDAAAPGWPEWVASQPDYLAPLHDGIRRGLGQRRPTVVVELGSGSGPATDVLATIGDLVVAADISLPMLRLNSARAARVECDVTRLPLRDGCADLVVGVNAVACWPEIRRVLGPAGSLLWVSTFGPSTPLYTEPSEVAGAFPDREALTSNAGHGSWVAVGSAGGRS